MINSVKLVAGKQPAYLKQEEIAGFLSRPEGTLWVSLEKASTEEIETVLTEIFQFHPLSVEDCLSIGYQTPKVDDFTDYIFIIANAVKPNGGFKSLDTLELNIYLGENYIVTCSTDDLMPCVESVWKRLERDERLAARGVDFLCHAILDALVDEYMPLIDQMDQEIEWLEDQVLEKPETATLERLLLLKHSLMSLRRIINPQREFINRLTRDQFPQISPAGRLYFRDIYDNLIRIQDLSESIRDIATGAVDIYLNATSLRLNVVMKALTIVSTIFLPLTFLAGVYGMNFKYFPELNWLYGYPLLWLVFLIIVVAMLIFFKKRGWF
jgi:magnesium transporter